MSLSNRTAIGVLWNFSDQLARRGVGLVVTLFLAKLLSPSDFGLIAMMALFLALGQSLMDSGFSQALIRLKDVQEIDYNTAFYANIVLGGCAYCILYWVAPLIAEFYKEADLINLVRVASIAIIINSFNAVQVASLSRNLNFKAQMKAAFPTGLLSGVIAITLASMGFGVWSLIAQMLMAALFQTMLLWAFNGWRPSLTFSFESLKEMHRFGYKLFLSGALETISRNLYVLIIAKYFSANIAGLYFFADRMKELVVSQIVTSIQKVTYPALSTQQDDVVQLKRGYRKVISVTVFAYFPVVTLLIVLAKPLYGIFLPEKWQQAHLYFQILCLASVLLPLHSINLNILRVLGRSDILLYLQILKKTMLVVAIFVGIRYGVMGVLIAQTVNSIISYYPNKFYSEKLIGYSMKDQWDDIKFPLLSCAILGGLAFFGQDLDLFSPMCHIIITGILFSFIYLICSIRYAPSVVSAIASIVRKK